MNLKELSPKLQQKFTKARGYGVMKLRNANSRWNNIYFVVPLPPPKIIKDSLPSLELSEALRIIGQLPQLHEMSDLDKMINYLFVRREVVQSSRLEGTWSTIDHALTPGELVDSGEAYNEHQAVRSYATILEDIVHKAESKKEKIFTKKAVCNIHKKIVENDPNSSGVPGKLRTQGDPGSIVTIGGGVRVENSVYNPTPASEVDRCLEEVLEWLRDDELAQKGDAAIGGLSLPVRIAVAHAHFEAVHPFTDGNGRVGRALWPLQMVCSGYMPLYLSGYVEENKEEYSHALQAAQKKLNYTPIIKFICNAIIESNLENVRTREAIANLENLWQERGGFRQNSAPRKTLRLLLTRPVITTSIIEQELGVSKTASTVALKSLVDKKIVRHRRTEKRQRIYVAEELIQILSRPFGSEIDIALEKAAFLLEL